MSNGKVNIDGFRNFIKAKYAVYYDNHFMDIIGLTPALFLGSKQDFRFMNIVYSNIKIHLFDLSNL